MALQGAGRRLAPLVLALAVATGERLSLDVGDGRYQAQANNLCNAGSDDVAGPWELTFPNRNGDDCSCECAAADCAEQRCPEGYEPEVLAHGTVECARYETASGEVIEGTEVEVHCPQGQLEVGGGRAVCSVKHECPAPPQVEGVVLLPGTGCGTCTYEVDCPPPAELKIRKGVAYCVTPPVTTPDVTTRHTRPLEDSCPQGSERRGGLCSKNLTCPTVVELSQQTLACGPKTDDYLHSFLQELGTTYARGRGRKASWKSCSTTCVAVFAKFSECAFQDDGPTCAGRAAKSGLAAVAMGHTAVPDAGFGMPWLQKARYPDRELPCKDMYGSEHNFRGTWYQAVEHVEKIAADYNILMKGTYVDEPFARLDCRKSFCGNADTHAQAGGRGKNGSPSTRSMGSCLAQCDSLF